MYKCYISANAIMKRLFLFSSITTLLLPSLWLCSGEQSHQRQHLRLKKNAPIPTTGGDQQFFKVQQQKQKQQQILGQDPAGKVHRDRRRASTNDLCASAHLLSFMTTEGNNDEDGEEEEKETTTHSAVTFATTIDATSPESEGAVLTSPFNAICQSSLETIKTTPAVWYKVYGTGETLLVSTCTNPSSTSDTISQSGFKAEIAVMVDEGSQVNQCETLSCVGTGRSMLDNDDNNNGTAALLDHLGNIATSSLLDYENSFCYQSELTNIAMWESTKGLLYYILVHGDSPTSRGDFAIQMQTVPNDDPFVISLLMNHDNDQEGDISGLLDELDDELGLNDLDDLENLENEIKQDEEQEFQQLLHEDDNQNDENNSSPPNNQDFVSILTYPSNNQCGNSAFNVDFDNDDKFQFDGSLIYATSGIDIINNNPTHVETCGSAFLPISSTNAHVIDAAGVWFRIIGTGHKMTVSTSCDLQQGYNTEIVLFHALSANSASLPFGMFVAPSQPTGGGMSMNGSTSTTQMLGLGGGGVGTVGTVGSGGQPPPSGNTANDELGIECGKLLCIDGDNTPCSATGQGGSVEFQSGFGDIFYVYVYSPAYKSGTFRLHVSKNNNNAATTTYQIAPPPSSSAAGGGIDSTSISTTTANDNNPNIDMQGGLPPPNDVCQYAVQLNSNNENNDQQIMQVDITSTKRGESNLKSKYYYDQGGLLTCGTSRISDETRGEWYKVMGTGQEWKISTCEYTNNIDTQITVFKSITSTSSDALEQCDSLVCVDGNNNDEYCGNDTTKASTVVVTLEENVLYYILIHSNQGDVGQFNFVIDIKNDIIHSTTTSASSESVFTEPQSEQPDSGDDADTNAIHKKNNATTSSSVSGKTIIFVITAIIVALMGLFVGYLNFCGSTEWAGRQYLDNQINKTADEIMGNDFDIDPNNNNVEPDFDDIYNNNEQSQNTIT